MKYRPAKKIITIFLVLTLVSSLSVVGFVISNANLVFAKKHNSSNGGSSSGSSSSDNSEGGSSGGSSSSSGGSGTSNNSPASPSPSTTQTTCPDGSTPDANGNCPTATSPSPPSPTSGCGPGTDNSTCSATPTPTPVPTPTPTTTNAAPQTQTQQTCPPLPLDANGNCPTSTPTPPPTPTPTTTNAAPHTLTQQTCPPLPIDENGNCPGIDMRGGGLGLPPAPQTSTTATTPMSTSQQGNCGPDAHMLHGNPNNCASDYFPYDDGSCPPGRIHIPGPEQYYCSIPPVLPGSTTGAGGGFIKLLPANQSGGTTTGTAGSSTTPFPPDVPLSGGGCPSGYHRATGISVDICKSDDIPFNAPPGNPQCVTGRHLADNPEKHVVECVPDNPTPSTTTTGGTTSGFHVIEGGFLTKDANPDGSCPQGTVHKGPLIPCFVEQISANQDGTCINGWTHFPGADAKACYMSSVVNPPTSGGSGTTTGGTTSTPMTTPMKTGGGTTTTGSGTTTSTTSAKTTTPTTTPKQTGTTGSTGTPTSTSTTTTTKIINNRNVVRGGSSGIGGATTTAPQVQPNNNLLTYVNTINKITIKYPPTWTKTELTGNPSIPVIFNPPTTTTTATGNAAPAAAAKNSFVISITPSVSNLDNFTQQRINALTHSNGVKYNITSTTAKVLTPPTGITAYREVSYNATKNILVNNTIPTLVPLKGAAIFFVNGGTGYSLLYLAKQTEYTKNLPMIQQMVNSFQIGNGGGTAANGAGVP